METTFAKADGGYGYPESKRSQVTWTWQVHRCHALLRHPLRDPKRLETMARRWIEQASGSAQTAQALELLQRAGGTELALPLHPPPMLPLITWVGSPPLTELEAQLQVDRLLRRPTDRALLEAFLSVWRAPDGGYRYPPSLEEVWPKMLEDRDFVALPRPHGAPSPVGTTAAAVACFRHAGIPIPEPKQVLSRIMSLRDRDCGLYASGVPGHGEPALVHTWHALRAIQLLEGTPEDPGQTRKAICALRHVHGGFAPAPDEPASLDATWMALECLAIVGKLPQDLEGEAIVEATLAEPVIDEIQELKLYQAVIQMGPDVGTSVMLAQRIGADLLLLKSLKGDEEQRVKRARALVAAQGFALEVACAREEHRRAIGINGIGYATHCSDMLWTPPLALKDRSQYSSWQDLVDAWRTDRAAGARVLACSYRHRELLAPFYDASARGSGYDALMLSWAFVRDGNLVDAHPWLHRYVGRISAIGNHDAHGDPFHWLHRGLRTRTFFFARSPTFESFREAIDRGRTIAVAHGEDENVLFGHPHWVQRMREINPDLTQGRGERTSGMWIPKPLAYAVEKSTACEWPGLEEGFGLVVRAAVALTDDALPADVQVWVNDRPREVTWLPPLPTGQVALGVRLPDLPAGRYPVRVRVQSEEQGLLESTFHLRWTEPLTKSTSATLPSFGRQPTILRFDSIEDLPFVQNTSLTFGDLEGRVQLVCRRADFILGPIPPGAEVLRLVFAPGTTSRMRSISLDGVELDLDEEEIRDLHEQRYSLPSGHPREGYHTVTLRLRLPAWMESFDRVPSDAYLHELAFGERP
jgi:hypothetical protein